jgi:hypothetical protein
MARITPKTNWVAHNIPVATDFNRIEGNNQQAFDEIDDLSDAIDTEEAARIAGDASLQLSKANKAIIGDNGGIGSTILVDDIVSGSGVYTHTYIMPRSAVWLMLTGSSYPFSGSSVSLTTSSPSSLGSRYFWQIG